MAKDDGRVVSNFILQALRGEDITIYGDGSYTRSFQYVDDLIEGMMRCMHKENFTGPVNLGNPDEFTIRELAERVVAETGSTSQITCITGPKIYSEQEPKKRKPDISYAKEQLRWEPRIPLVEGLKKTVDYFRTTL